MKYAFFPGCVLESAAKEDYLATVAVAKKLGIELEELDGWTCCGASHVQDIAPEITLATNARNIALAEEKACGRTSAGRMPVFFYPFGSLDTKGERDSHC